MVKTLGIVVFGQVVVRERLPPQTLVARVLSGIPAPEVHLDVRPQLEEEHAVERGDGGSAD